MMRDIKFRAWDGEAMYPHEDIGEDYYFSFGKDGLILELNEQFHECGSGVAEEYWEYVEKKGAVFMQFTGLQDKNGVDIYEGDVVETTYHGTNSTSKFKPKCVAWDLSKCGFNISKGIETEVIGNIHENKELLESNNVQ